MLGFGLQMFNLGKKSVLNLSGGASGVPSSESSSHIFRNFEQEAPPCKLIQMTRTLSNEAGSQLNVANVSSRHVYFMKLSVVNPNPVNTCRLGDK